MILVPGKEASSLVSDLSAGRLSAGELLGGYCRWLYARLGTYEAVAKQHRLDRRTVKKHMDSVR